MNKMMGEVDGRSIDDGRSIAPMMGEVSLET